VPHDVEGDCWSAERSANGALGPSLAGPSLAGPSLAGPSLAARPRTVEHDRAPPVGVPKGAEAGPELGRECASVRRYGGRPADRLEHLEPSRQRRDAQVVRSPVG